MSHGVNILYILFILLDKNDSNFNEEDGIGKAQIDLLAMSFIINTL